MSAFTDDLIAQSPTIGAQLAVRVVINPTISQITPAMSAILLYAVVFKTRVLG